MKKAFSLIAVMLLCLSLCACGVADTAVDAFTNTDMAYDLTNTFSSDIYEAWFMGINEKDEIMGATKGYYSTTYNYVQGYTYFCDQLDIESMYIDSAIESYIGTSGAQGYELLIKLSDSVFSTCVSIVTKAYKLSGKTDDIAEYVESAKDALLKLSKKGANYEHYSDLKYYLAETAAFYDFCCNPEGSFEQVVETFNAYRNDAREYYNVLALFFEDPNAADDILPDISPIDTTAPAIGY